MDSADLSRVREDGAQSSGNKIVSGAQKSPASCGARRVHVNFRTCPRSVRPIQSWELEMTRSPAASMNSSRCSGGSQPTARNRAAREPTTFHAGAHGSGRQMTIGRKCSYRPRLTTSTPCASTSASIPWDLRAPDPRVIRALAAAIAGADRSNRVSRARSGGDENCSTITRHATSVHYRHPRGHP